MNIKPQKIITILLALVLVAGCFAIMPLTSTAAPAKDNPNQDFTGTPVTVEASAETVFVGESAFITITIDRTNPKADGVTGKGALPEVTIWVNGERVGKLGDIKEGVSVTFLYEVDTQIPGEKTFEIEVWTRIGNKNFQDDLYDGEAIVMDVIEKTKTPAEWIADITGAINDAIADTNGGNIVSLVRWVEGANKSYIQLVIDGVTYVFIGGNGANSDKILEIDGRIYTITIQANGARFTVR